MLHGHDVICISSIDWDFIWQGHQEIMATLARHGNRVLFIENTGVRAPTFRDLPRLRQRIRNWVRGIKGFRQEADNLFIYSPVIVPFPYSRVVRRVNRTLLMQALRRWMRTMSFRPAIVWTFLPTPLARDIIRAVDPDVSVYYCIDDFASSSPTAKRIRHSEHQLFREVDLVFVTSQRLQERAAQHHPHVTLFPFGVDFETFSSIRQTPQPVPGELRQLTRPVVGYVGGLHQWVDQELLERAVSQLLDVNFVFIGPQQTDLSRLRRYTNAHFLGARRHEDIPSYIKGFDLGMVPYRLSEYTAHVYPPKLNEDLAMGIPVWRQTCRRSGASTRSLAILSAWRTIRMGLSAWSKQRWLTAQPRGSNVGLRSPDRTVGRRGSDRCPRISSTCYMSAEAVRPRGSVNYAWSTGPHGIGFCAS